tara:strand:+ start:257 stop:802 length:546 start_codon:yes stop_codon:yes gene_type:complete
MEELILGRFANTVAVLSDQSINISSFVRSFSADQVNYNSWLANEVANSKMQWSRALIIGDCNSCLMYEMLNKYCDITWFDFLGLDEIAHRERNFYFNSNDIERNYANIKMSYTDFSDEESYDLIISTEDIKLTAVFGPTYALQVTKNFAKSENILAKNSNITNKMFTGLQNNKRMVIGYYF